ncbi:MAG: histone deacetylase family protein [Candidatus Shapirobacteria bacterium]|jgi:acetoin utilization deacetylase AcuC-like enzyme
MNKIPIIYSLENKKYSPVLLWNEEHFDQVKRIDNILSELKKKNIGVEFGPENLETEFIKEIHDSDYVDFLGDLDKSIIDEAYHFPTDFWHDKKRELSSFLPKLGRFSLDIYTPVSKNIFTSILSSAAVAYTAAKKVVDGNKIVYALTRPSGHHAMKSLMGGFCYLNNAAIAAQYLSKLGTVAVLDIDYHHGNGTQDIFYDRGDVLTVSIHADPRNKFPYYWGFEDEIGVGLGENKNLNIILSSGANDNDYSKALKKALEKIKIFGPKYLVISLGLDTYKKDLLGDFKLTNDYYQNMAKEIESLNCPTVIVQEGGYHEDVGKNVFSFLSGFLT